MANGNRKTEKKYRTQLLTMWVVSALLVMSASSLDLRPRSVAPVGGGANITCDGHPPIQSFHVHVVFEGNNFPATTKALSLYADFIASFNASMEVCPFAHPNPAGWYGHICVFPFNATLYPQQGGSVFNAANFAFFVPRAFYLEASEWWRVRHSAADRLDWAVHANTGCADRDHTEWSAFSYGYRFPINAAALWCCHDGPPGCSCDIAQYSPAAPPVAAATPASAEAVAAATSQCLGTGEDGAGKPLVLADCAAGLFANATWRETTFTPSFKQVELYGDKHQNPGLCAGTARGACAAGEPLALVECAAADGAAARLSWQDGQLRSDSCAGLCAGVAGRRGADGQTMVVLLDCAAGGTQWTRAWIRG